MKTRAVFVFFVYIVAANIPCWIASHSMGLLLTGLFNIELAVVGILSVFLRRGITVGLLLVTMLLDVLRGIGVTYLLSPSAMLRSVRYLPESAPSHLWGTAAVASCIVAIFLMAAAVHESHPTGRERAYAVLGIAVFVVMCGTVDVSMGRTASFGRDWQVDVLRLTRFPAHSLVMDELRYEEFHRMHPGGPKDSVAAASQRVVRFEAASASSRADAMLPNVVLILVESWGKPVDALLEESLVRPYSDKNLAEKYTLSQGVVPFHGPTVSGEARELCGSAMGFGLLTASRSELKGCLPETMRRVGYHSTAVHGYSAMMFDRGEWYGRIGFDESWFRDRLQGQGLALCPGPFPGICDAAASAWIGDRLQREGDSPQFIYWVTLNSHLPVPIPNRVENAPSCADNAVTAGSPGICSWYQLEFNVHRSVSELALRPTARPTIFLIVGDHAPPFSSARSRAQFSDQVVPYVLLMPKRDGAREGSRATRSVSVAARPPAGVRKPHGKSGKALSTSAVGG
jgi:phosphoglycerol transferase MdoB-like AlkP superfamily enzyme